MEHVTLLGLLGAKDGRLYSKAYSSVFSRSFPGKPFSSLLGDDMNVVDTTYEALFGAAGLATLGEMAVGQVYRFTFDWHYPHPDGVTPNGSESLLVRAVSPSQIDKVAASEDYPEDYIEYSPRNDIWSPASTTGCITWREYVPRALAWDCNWRAVIVRRWETVETSGVFDSRADTGFAYQDFPLIPEIPAIGETGIGNLASITGLIHRNGDTGANCWPNGCFQNASAYKVFLDWGNDGFTFCNEVLDYVHGTCSSIQAIGSVKSSWSAPNCDITVKGSIFFVQNFKNGLVVNGGLVSCVVLPSFRFTPINGNFTGVEFGHTASYPGSLSEELINDPEFGDPNLWYVNNGGIANRALTLEGEGLTDYAYPFLGLNVLVGATYICDVYIATDNTGDGLRIEIGDTSASVSGPGFHRVELIAADAAYGFKLSNTTLFSAGESIVVGYISVRRKL